MSEKEEKVILPYHFGQKVTTNPQYAEPYSKPQRFYKKQTGYIYEMMLSGDSYAYSMILVDENGEYAGGQAWYNHEGLIFLEDVSEKSIKKLKSFLRRKDWE